MTQRHIGAVLCALWLACGALLLNGATIRIPPARAGAVRVQSASAVVESTASAAPKLGLAAAFYHGMGNTNNYVKTTGNPGIWYDSSGNGRHFSAVTDGNSPVMLATGVVYTINSQTLNAPTGFVRGNGPMTVVVRATPVDNTGSVGYLFTGGVTGDGALLARYNGQLIGYDPTYFTGGAGSNIASGETAVVAAVFNGSNSSVWKNGAKISTVNAGTPSGSGLMSIGNYAGIYAWRGAIQMVLIYRRALTDAELAHMNGWF